VELDEGLLTVQEGNIAAAPGNSTQNSLGLLAADADPKYVRHRSRHVLGPAGP